MGILARSRRIASVSTSCTLLPICSWYRLARCCTRRQTQTNSTTYDGARLRRGCRRRLLSSRLSRSRPPPRTEQDGKRSGALTALPSNGSTGLTSQPRFSQPALSFRRPGERTANSPATLLSKARAIRTSIRMLRLSPASMRLTSRASMPIRSPRSSCDQPWVARHLRTRCPRSRLTRREMRSVSLRAESSTSATIEAAGKRDQELNPLVVLYVGLNVQPCRISFANCRAVVSPTFGGSKP